VLNKYRSPPHFRAYPVTRLYTMQYHTGAKIELVDQRLAAFPQRAITDDFQPCRWVAICDLGKGFNGKVRSLLFNEASYCKDPSGLAGTRLKARRVNSTWNHMELFEWTADRRKFISQKTRRRDHSGSGSKKLPIIADVAPTSQ